jgi:hypothetical protein
MSKTSDTTEKDTITDDDSGMDELTTAVDAWAAASMESKTETQLEATAYWNDEHGSRVELSLNMPYGTTMVNLDADDAKEFAQVVSNAAAIAEHRQAKLDTED